MVVAEGGDKRQNASSGKGTKFKNRIQRSSPLLSIQRDSSIFAHFVPCNNSSNVEDAR